jgi:hypothetical protein
MQEQEKILLLLSFNHAGMKLKLPEALLGR